MAEENENTSNESVSEEKKKVREYEKILKRLKKEQQALRDEAEREYQVVRGYVRSHPTEGVLYSFLGGIVLGILIGRAGRD